MFYTKLDTIFKREHLSLLLLLIFCLTLFGCAASKVSRDAASNIDMGMNNLRRFGSGDGDIADAYQNTSQATKGAIIGGAAGAVTGAVASSSLGVFPGTVLGVIFGAAYGSYIDSNTTLTDRLENRGVSIAVIGDQILIVIPSSRIFYEGSSTIKPQSYSTLILVADYIRSYTKMLVRVAGYTDLRGSAEIDALLSREQAQNVSKFLYESGVNARVLYADGYGGQRLVAKTGSGWESDNYRIEISLQKIDDGRIRVEGMAPQPDCRFYTGVMPDPSCANSVSFAPFPSPD